MPATFARPVPWEKIHRQTFLAEDRCWTTCNGGFCCSNNHPDFQFQLIPTEGTTILYMEEEHRWLAQNGRVFDPATPEGTPRYVSIDFGGPRPLSILQMPCRLLGKCTGVIDKPLLCKLYPMLPVLDVDGGLETIQPASIFELTMHVLGMKTPCTVVDKVQHYWHKWKNAPEHLEALNHPYIIFHLQAAKHFADIYAEKLQQSEALRGLRGKLFWRMWEIEYLLGGLIDAELLAGMIRSTYEALVERHGLFFSAEHPHVGTVGECRLAG
jgi:hypothetical protein